MGLDDDVVHADQSLTAIRYGLDPLASGLDPVVEAMNTLEIQEEEQG